MALDGWSAHGILREVQKFISKYAAAAHLALLAVSPLFLFPWCGSEVLTWVLAWLTAPALLWVVLEPSRRSDEHLHDARERVGGELLRDPLLWVFVVIAVLALLRWLNNGVVMSYDAENEYWFLKEAEIAFLPAAVPTRGGMEFMLVLATAVIVEGCRHALGKAARLSFLFTSSLLSGVAALAVALSGYFGHSGVQTAQTATFVNPSFVGTVFGLYMLAAIIAFAGGLESQWRKITALSIFAIGANGAGLFLFAPTVVILLFAVAAIPTLLFAIIWSGTHAHGAAGLKCFVGVFTGLVIAVFFVVCCAPDGLSSGRISLIASGEILPEGFWELRAKLSEIAAKVWKSSPWFGTGVGSFPLDIRFNTEAADWKLINIQQSAVPSGWWTLLVERGIVGAVMIALPLCFMLFTFLRRIPNAIGKPIFLPAAWLGITVVLVIVAETFIDVSFLRPEVMMTLGAFFVLTAGAMPPVKRKEEEKGD